MKNGIYILLVFLLIFPLACKKQETSAPSEVVPEYAYISGSISYRERIALTQLAVVELSLQDVSLADAPAKVIANQRISNPGQVPIKFKLEYPRKDIDERRSYSLQVRISDKERLMFVNDTHIPVLTRGAGREVHVPLVQAQNLEPEENEVLEGMFRYMADAALFRDCRTNLVFPVAMEAQYIELEHAYLNSGVAPGAEMLARLQGRYLERKDMDSKNNIIKLIVDNLKHFSTNETCAPTTHAELQNTYWKLVELDGKKVSTPEGMREAHLILARSDSRAHGFAGCNNFFGGYQADGNALSFSAMGATMMACPEGMDTEQAFLQALGETTRFEISGQFLTLFADDRPLARLEAVYL